MANCSSYPAVHSAFTDMMKAKRAEKQLGYKKVGEMIGMSRSYVTNIEQGLYDTSMEIGFAICTALDIPVELFIDHMFQVKQLRMLLDIERSCTDWGIPIPPQFKKEKFIPEEILT